ncbi:MAG: DUF6602 domain-containing protein [Chitinophagales bacterium]
MLSYYDQRQFKIVEFAEQVYHAGLRHSALNGSLYEDFLIKYLREDVPNKTFFKGQIYSRLNNGNTTSSQFDIMICKEGTEQKDFLKNISKFINIVDVENVYGVIELKKWANPKMISFEGPINEAYSRFSREFPQLTYLFVALRFKDRKFDTNKHWRTLSSSLQPENKFCLYGRTDHSYKEGKFPWDENQFETHKNYLGQYEKLISSIKSLR